MSWSCWCADPADALILLMSWSCWSNDSAEKLILLTAYELILLMHCLILLMSWSSWSADPADPLILLMSWSCWCADPANVMMRWCSDPVDVLILLMRWSFWCADPAVSLIQLILLMRWSCWCAVPADPLILLISWSCWCPPTHSFCPFPSVRLNNNNTGPSVSQMNHEISWLTGLSEEGLAEWIIPGYQRETVKSCQILSKFVRNESYFESCYSYVICRIELIMSTNVIGPRKHLF